jgi:hypothetical protein
MNVGPVERLGLTRKVRPLPTRLEACMHVGSFVRSVEAFWGQPSSCKRFWGTGILGLVWRIAAVDEDTVAAL